MLVMCSPESMWCPVAVIAVGAWLTMPVGYCDDHHTLVKCVDRICKQTKMLLCPSAVRAVGAQVWKMTDMCCRRWIVGWVLMCNAMCLPSFCCVLRLSTKALGARLTMTGTGYARLTMPVGVTECLSTSCSSMHAATTRWWAGGNTVNAGYCRHSE